MRLLNVVHDTLPFAVGGVEVYVSRLSDALAEQGVEVAILSSVDTAGRRPYERGLLDGRVPVHTVAHRLGRNGQSLRAVAADRTRMYLDPSVDAACADVVERFRPDIVHVHHLVHLSGSLIGLLRRMGLPVVVTLHDYWFLCITGQLVNDQGAHLPDRCGVACLEYVLHNRHKASGVLRWGLRRSLRIAPGFFERLLLRRRSFLLAQLSEAEVVLAPSRFLAGVYVDAGLRASSLKVSPYGVPSSPVRPAGPLGTVRPLRVGYLGRVVPEKGLHVLLDAFEGLDEGFELHVHGVATPSSDYAEKLGPALRGLRIRNHGAYENGRVSEVLATLDVLAVPSVWWENAPLVILEALAAGVPVVASDLGGMRELVRDGENGLLFEAGNAGALAAVLRRLGSEPGLLARVRPKAGKQKTVDEDAAELVEVYRRLVPAGSSVPAGVSLPAGVEC